MAIKGETVVASCEHMFNRMMDEERTDFYVQVAVTSRNKGLCRKACPDCPNREHVVIFKDSNWITPIRPSSP